MAQILSPLFLILFCYGCAELNQHPTKAKTLQIQDIPNAPQEQIIKPD